jgi:Leucine-rich repeat (LRR) protein
MEVLEKFADDINEIDISNKNILGPLDFSRFTKLTKLKCSNNKITSLDCLPN